MMANILCIPSLYLLDLIPLIYKVWFIPHIMLLFFKNWHVTLFCLLAKAIFDASFESVRVPSYSTNIWNILSLDLDVAKHCYVHTLGQREVAQSFWTLILPEVNLKSPFC